MDFAKNLLKKYGWKEGDGLGKHNNGISKPLHTNLKFDTSGLGLDKGEEFKNHWWERVFNEAADNVNINKSGENIEISVKNVDSVEITTKDYAIGKLQSENGKNGYKYFMKKSVLNGSKETYKTDLNEGGVDEEQLKLPKYQILNDHELLAACGGRTAHKGARHGLKLSGKLSRLEEQERKLIEAMQMETDGNIKDKDNWKIVTSKKKAKRKQETVDNSSELQSILFSNEYCVKSKKKRKKEKQLDNELTSLMNCAKLNITGNSMISEIDTMEEAKKEKSISVNNNGNTSMECKDSSFPEISTGISKKKSKKKKRNEGVIGSEEDTQKFL